MDRRPKTTLGPHEWAALEKRWDGRTPREGASGNDSEAPLERAVVRASIIGSERVETAPSVDAVLTDGSAAKFVLRFRVDEIVEGSLDLPYLRVAVRSPIEQFAYPISETRRFTLALERKGGADHVFRILSIDPPADVLIREAQEAIQAAEGEGDRDGEDG
jgi:hypothetical protein